MTDIEINIAIAKACGIRCGVNPHYGRALRLVVRPGETVPKFGPPIPDYVHDLNAMHEAEKVLLTTERYDYYKWAIAKVVYPEVIDLDISMLSTEVVCATARQRAEAFLRTLNLWKEANQAP